MGKTEGMLHDAATLLDAMLQRIDAAELIELDPSMVDVVRLAGIAGSKVAEAIESMPISA